MNNVNIIGRMTFDPSVRGNEDSKVVTISVAVDSGYGEHKRTDFIPIVAFGKTAEFVERYLGKGRLVAVEGSIRMNKYTKKDGTKATDFQVYASNITALDRAKDGGEDFSPSGFEEVTESIPF